MLGDGEAWPPEGLRPGRSPLASEGPAGIQKVLRGEPNLTPSHSHLASGFMLGRGAEGTKVIRVTIVTFKGQTVKEEIWVWSLTYPGFNMALLLRW